MADQCCPPHRPFRQWVPPFHHSVAMSEEHQPVAAITPLLESREETPTHPFLVGLGIILSSLMPIAGIVLGAVYLDQCPRQPLVPIYVIVLSVMTIFLTLLSSFPCGEGSQRLKVYLQFASLLFLSVWFIAGSVWIYSIYPPNYEAVGHRSYCQRNLFLFAFAITTGVHATLGLALLLSLCILATIFICSAVVPYGVRWGLGEPTAAAGV